MKESIFGCCSDLLSCFVGGSVPYGHQYLYGLALTQQSSSIGCVIACIGSLFNRQTVLNNLSMNQQVLPCCEVPQEYRGEMKYKGIKYKIVKQSKEDSNYYDFQEDELLIQILQITLQKMSQLAFKVFTFCQEPLTFQQSNYFQIFSAILEICQLIYNMDPQLLKTISPKQYYQTLYQNTTRPDHRSIMKPRNYAISIVQSTDSQQCVVRLGNTSVMATSYPNENDQIVTIEGDQYPEIAEFISGFQKPNFKVVLRILIDDGNLWEAAALAYQFSFENDNILYPFTYADVFKYIIRDPTKDELQHANSVVILLMNQNMLNVFKPFGLGIALSDLQRLIEMSQQQIQGYLNNTATLLQNKSFIGKFHR